MTVPIMTSAPGVVLSPAAVADLRLHLSGVRLPWLVLGGSLSGRVDPGPDPVCATATATATDHQYDIAHDLDLPRQVGVIVADDVDITGWDGSTLLLLDQQNAPVATLVASTTSGAGLGKRAQGEIESLDPTQPGALGQDLAGALVIIAMRPWLTADDQLRDLALPTPAPPAPAAPATAQPATALPTPATAQPTPAQPRRDTAALRIVVLVPSDSASPDGIPAQTLRRCIARAATGESARPVSVEVRAAPLVWRDAASDHALARAVAQALPQSRTVVLEPDHPDWRAMVQALSAGEPLPPALLAAGPARALLQWRPPPGTRGLVVMFTGLSGSGKSTLADALVAWLGANTDRTVTLLDGDVVRQQLSSELGFDLASRDLNIRRIGYVAGEIARHHGIAICAPIAPFDASRKVVRTLVEPLGDFVLIHMATPLAECERRDRKGLYAKARSGLLQDFTGISSPYEVPLDADLVLDTSPSSVDQSLAQVLDLLRAGQWLPPGGP